MIVTSERTRTAFSHRICPGSRAVWAKLIAEPAEPWTAREEYRLRERRGRERQRAAGASPGHELAFAERVLATLAIPALPTPARCPRPVVLDFTG